MEKDLFCFPICVYLSPSAVEFDFFDCGLQDGKMHAKDMFRSVFVRVFSEGMSFVVGGPETLGRQLQEGRKRGDLRTCWEC